MKALLLGGPCDGKLVELSGSWPHYTMELYSKEEVTEIRYERRELALIEDGGKPRRWAVYAYGEVPPDHAIRLINENQLPPLPEPES